MCSLVWFATVTIRTPIFNLGCRILQPENICEPIQFSVMFQHFCSICHISSSMCKALRVKWWSLIKVVSYVHVSGSLVMDFEYMGSILEIRSSLQKKTLTSYWLVMLTYVVF